MSKRSDDPEDELGLPPVLPPADEPGIGGTPLAPVIGPPGLTALDLVDAAARAEAEPKPESALGGLGLGEITALALGLPSVVGPSDDPDAPRLPLSDDEPPPVSSLDARQSLPDPNALAVLERYTRRQSLHARSKRALLAAIAGEPHTPGDMPDARAMLLGICRILVQSGVPAEAIAEAVADAMGE